VVILPARTKLVRKGSNLHFFCPGEGCGARLACGNTDIRTDTGWEIEVRLEPRYTNGPHPSYPAGTWWRQKRGGYKGLPRARDARKAERDVERATEGVSPEAVSQVVKETLKRGNLLDLALGSDFEEHATPEKWHEDVVRRGEFHRVTYILGQRRHFCQPAPVLPPGTHIVICYRCGGKASIKAPFPGSLGPRP